MTEQHLLGAVLELARILGVLAHHEPDSRRSDPGFPDLVLAGKRGVVFAELKTEDGQLSRAQTSWRWRLIASGASWFLWRPANLESGEILEVLRAIA